MKTFFTKFRVLIWVILLLMALNITVIATLLYRNYYQRRIVTRQPVEMQFQRQGHGAYLKNELNLNNEQFLKFQEARSNYQQSAWEIHSRIKIMRSNYLDELVKNKPDIALLKSTQDSIGFLHASLLNETGNYYNHIRQLCHQDQINRLSAFFKKAMQAEDPVMMRGQCMPNGPRNAGRYGRNNRNKYQW